jgi:hypothetical protein
MAALTRSGNFAVVSRPAVGEILRRQKNVRERSVITYQDTAVALWDPKQETDPRPAGRSSA